MATPEYNAIGKAPDPFKLDPFGGMAAGDRSRDYLLKDLKKMEAGQLGMSTSEKSKATSAAVDSAAAGIQAQAKDVGQMSLAAGPMSAVSGRAAKVQRDAAGQIGNARALASSQTEQTSQALAEQQKQAIRANLEREQDRNRQDTQFWVSLLLNPDMVSAAGNAVTSAVASAGKNASGGAGGTPAAAAPAAAAV